MKKAFSILLIVILSILNSNVVYANTNKLDPKYYTSDGKIKIYSNWYGHDEAVFRGEIGKIDNVLPNQSFVGADEKQISGIMIYSNYNEMTEGNFKLVWIFSPDDSEVYESKTGIYNLYLYPNYTPDTEESKGKIKSNETVLSIESVSLTATKLLLDNQTSYDINVDNKISGSSYTWTSSNEKVAKVNSKNGKVFAVDKGETDITCKIITPDGDITILSSTVTVGTDDDNLPLLTETDLLLEVDDKFDINIGNKIKGSKYKWVSSDKSITKVTTTSGKVTAINKGEAVVTCIITTSNNEVIVLKCLVTVE